jgi:hypothetical protein
MLAKTIDTSFYFELFNELINNAHYHEMIYLNFTNMNLELLPEILPQVLQILVFDINKIKELPILPSTIRMISGRGNKLTCIPDLSHCTELETIDLYDNYIYYIGKLPPQIRSLELSFNKLCVINYNLIPETLVSLGVSYNFITEHPPIKWRSKILYDHNNIDEPYQRYTRTSDTPLTFLEPIRYNPNNIVPKIEHVVYKNAQNVHTHSIQQSVNKSLDYIINYKSKASNNSYFDEIKELFKTKYSWWFFSRTVYDNSKIRQIKYWCSDSTIHSNYGVTFGQLLRRVWEIIQEHEHKEVMKSVLKEELIASMGLCFTGRFTRVINSLSGFVEEVSIGISSREQMQNQIAAAIKRSNPHEEVKRILKEHGVNESEWQPWLDVIDY